MMAKLSNDQEYKILLDLILIASVPGHCLPFTSGRPHFFVKKPIYRKVRLWACHSKLCSLLYFDYL